MYRSRRLKSCMHEGLCGKGLMRRAHSPPPQIPTGPFVVRSCRIRCDVCVFQGNEEVKALGEDVKEFARRWPMPGFEVSELKFKEMDH